MVFNTSLLAVTALSFSHRSTFFASQRLAYSAAHLYGSRNRWADSEFSEPKMFITLPWKTQFLTQLIPISLLSFTSYPIYLSIYLSIYLCIRPPPTRLSISVALGPQANYTDWATAICRRNLVPTFVDRGVSRGQRGGSPTVVNLSFLDRSCYFSFT
jgi:hypothetical protein